MKRKFDFNIVPAHMQEPLRQYCEERILQSDFSQGDFLRAVLRNDLMFAFAYADDINREYMHDWACFLWTLPTSMFGSKAVVDAWLSGADE